MFGRNLQNIQNIEYTKNFMKTKTLKNKIKTYLKLYETKTKID